MIVLQLFKKENKMKTLTVKACPADEKIVHNF